MPQEYKNCQENGEKQLKCTKATQTRFVETSINLVVVLNIAAVQQEVAASLKPLHFKKELTENWDCQLQQ